MAKNGFIKKSYSQQMVGVLKGQELLGYRHLRFCHRRRDEAVSAISGVKNKDFKLCGYRIRCPGSNDPDVQGLCEAGHSKP